MSSDSKLFFRLTMIEFNILYSLLLLTMFELKIATYNVRGLRNNTKRAEIFEFLQTSEKAIFCLQECHYDKGIDGHTWKNEWKGLSFSDLSDKILIQDSKCDVKGRYLSLDFECFGENFSLLNIYGHNLTPLRPAFFNSLLKICPDPNSNFILAGDFNMVIDLDKDRLGGTPSPHHHTFGASELSQILQKSEIVDVCHHHNILPFTWHSSQDEISSRLDRIYISKHLAGRSHPPETYETPFSDHLLFATSINFVNRGPGFWKLNTSILEDRFLKVPFEVAIYTILEKAKTRHCRAKTSSRNQSG